MFVGNAVEKHTMYETSALKVINTIFNGLEQGSANCGPRARFFF